MCAKLTNPAVRLEHPSESLHIMDFTALPLAVRQGYDDRKEKETIPASHGPLTDSEELEALLDFHEVAEIEQRRQPRWLLLGLCASNVVLLALAIALAAKLYSVKECRDPSLGVWCKLFVPNAQAVVLIVPSTRQ